MESMIHFIKNWTLPIAMLSGVAGYFIYVNIPFLAPTRPFVNRAVDFLQPVLIFLMLFLSFCKISLHDLRPCRWHLWLLLVQAGSFTLLGGILLLFRDMSAHMLMEGAMICLICPTATAGAVITQRLGGNAAHLATYTILINLVTAFLVPLIVPLVHPHPVRYLLPHIHQILLKYGGISFYLWAVALALAIAVTTKSIVHSEVSVWYQSALALIALACCGLQFYIGKRIGKRYDDTISAGQSLGQKNTVFAIWMGYTFFTPVTAVAGGFYSVWHNIVNSWQLYRQRKREEAEEAMNRE